MKTFLLTAMLFVVVGFDCRLTWAQPRRLPVAVVNSSNSWQTNKPGDNAYSTPELEISQPENMLPMPRTEGELLPRGNESLVVLTLQDLEQIALSNNPAIGQAEARVRALRGTWVQAGLPPNPSIGYLATEIGDEGRAGQQGAYVGQDFITGGKLRLDRAVVAQEIQRAEQQMAATQLRVQTDVRTVYYNVLLAQRRAELATELVGLTGEAVGASRQLIAAQEIPQAGLLQTEVEQQNALILSQTAMNRLEGEWRQLLAVLGSGLPIQRLAGDVTELPAMLNWDEQLQRITTASPEAAAALADLARAQTALRRARVEPIPDLSTQLSVQYDSATEDTIAGVQVGIPLPLWNRNQGRIRQAEAEVTEAMRNASRVELDLTRRLAAALQEYSIAHTQAETYRSQILPKTKETLQLVQRGFSLGELGYLDLLNAQRIYSQTNLAYLDALEVLWRSRSEIDGLLLTGSLAQSPEQ